MTFGAASLRLLLRLMVGIPRPFSLVVINNGIGGVKRVIFTPSHQIKERTVAIVALSALIVSFYLDTTI